MTSLPPAPRDDRSPTTESSQGLRLRLWLGCLGGALVGAGGMWWVVGTHAGPGTQLDLPVLITWLSATAALAILVGVALALWLDSGIIGHLRGLANSLVSGRVSELRGLPAGAGWGELSRLTQQVQLLLTHQRQIARTAEELGLIRAQLASTRASLERWVETERWEGARVEPGALAPLVESLDRGLRRLDEVRDQNVEAARQIGATVGIALAEARDTAGEAERGFVEATALLTTVRELQRLGGELEQSLASPAAGPANDDAEARLAWRAAARSAILELVESSSGSVEHVGRGLLRVQEIADQVHLVANRATLIALNAALTGARQGRPEPEMAELSEEMKRLAAEVRGATERTSALSLEIEGEIAAAIERMRGVRQRVAERLEELPVPSIGEVARTNEPSRLLERVREMIQDAAQKGERLSAAGERVSRAAERLVRRLEEEVQELAGMVVRLSPPEEAPSAANETPAADSPATPESPGGTAETESSAPRPPGLKLLGQEHLLPGEESRGTRKHAGGPGPGGSGAGRGERS
jgi:methyl-accepting chemotaxis protein